MFILQFFLIVFIVVVAVVAFVAWRAWRRIHKAVDQFNQQFGGGAQAQQQEAPRQQRTTTMDSGETIIDTRSQEKANQKIFSKDEGEYVDDYEVRE